MILQKVTDEPCPGQGAGGGAEKMEPVRPQTKVGEIVDELSVETENQDHRAGAQSGQDQGEAHGEPLQQFADQSFGKPLFQSGGS